MSMKKWKKSEGLRGILLFVLIAAIAVEVISAMYMNVGRQYIRFGEEKRKDFFVSQEETKNLLDGYIRLFDEYMQIGDMITTDGDIDYDKIIMTSVDGKRAYTVKELLKNADYEGEASGRLKKYMDHFAQNCREGESYPWLTRYSLGFDEKIILDEGTIYSFTSPNAIALSPRQISDMLLHQQNMVSISSSKGEYHDLMQDSLSFSLSNTKERKITFHAKSSYEEYIITYFNEYAQYYFLNQAVQSYQEKGQDKFLAAYDSYCKKDEKYTDSKKIFYELIQKKAQDAKKSLSEGQIPWRAHVIPRSLDDAKRYVTFLVETFQEMKYLFSKSNFVFAYENSSNLCITNNEKLWGQVKDKKGAEGLKKAQDTDSVTFAYYDSKGESECSSLYNDSFLMSGNVIERIKNIGATYDKGSYQICVGLDLAGIRSQKYKEDKFTIQYIASNRKAELFERGQIFFLVGAVIFVLVFGLLVMMCGYRRDKDSYALLWYDRIWFEAELFVGFVFIRMIVWLLKLWNGSDIQALLVAYGMIITILVFCCVGIVFSMIKRTKLKCFTDYSLLLLFVREVISRKMKVSDWAQSIERRFAFMSPRRKYRILFLFEAGVILYAAVCAVFIRVDRKVTVGNFMTSELGICGMILGVLLFIVLFCWQRNTLVSEETGILIVKGTKKIMDGDFKYQLPKTEGIGYREAMLIDTVNHIGEVLERAVEESVRSERMKTELIANVSHDIKTPLTSVINYVDLLKRQDIPDEVVQKYLTVLERKSQRLKTLIEDLVEASKASSGAMELDIHTLNFNELIVQTNGEFEDRYEECSIELISEIPEKPLYFQGDGRRVFRILENLYNNTAKYAMPHTRVYVSLESVDGEVVFTMKNISATKLNITADELTERFVRGDRSRSTEGSGLGLSIAKSLTELMGGHFEIVLDGDLFCARVSFEKSSLPQA